MESFQKPKSRLDHEGLTPLFSRPSTEFSYKPREDFQKLDAYEPDITRLERLEPPCNMHLWLRQVVTFPIMYDSTSRHVVDRFMAWTLSALFPPPRFDRPRYQTHLS